MAQSKTGKSQEGYYARYKTNKTWETNRKRRLERALKAQPTNQQIILALKNMVYRRKTPKVRVWSASWVATAKLFKLFAGRFDPAIMSSDPNAAGDAAKRPGPVALDKHFKLPTSNKSFFSIETRIYKGSK